MPLSTDHSDVPLAVIGMACRLPGAANLEEYWDLIRNGKSAIAEIPPERFDQNLYYDPKRNTRAKSYAKTAALLADKTFDDAQCPLPAELRREVDLNHLLMTGTAAEALRHGGLDPFELPQRNTAVFIGHAQASSLLDSSSLFAELEDLLALTDNSPEFAALAPAEQAAVRREVAAALKQQLPNVTGNIRPLQCNMMAGTIAKAFGLSGPWLSLNSACASSLHAILLGARALQSGRVDMAIVGGASDCKSDSLVLFSNAQTLSTTGSRPFDADADGLVMGEGYVCLVMKTLERALADGDPVQAVIRGMGVATDGRGKSLWAPRKEGQTQAIKRAYRSGVDPARVQYIECHATATQVGDATEMESIQEAFGSVLPPGKKIPLTSVKANIGHALEAAGGAGIIKAILCLQHQTIPPAINISRLNPKIDWDKSPCYIPLKPERWEAPADGTPRCAGINAFGIGGLNMHVVLDEFTATARKKPALRTQPAPTADDTAVAIIGIGCILPGAANPAEYWELLRSGRDPKIPAPVGRWSKRAIAEQTQRGMNTLGGFITNYQYDWRKHKVPPKQVSEADPLQFMLLDATEQALTDAGFSGKTWNRERCGVIMGGDFGGDFSDQLEFGLRIPLVQKNLAAALQKRGLSAAQIEAVLQFYSDQVVKNFPSLIDESGSFTSSTLASRISKTLDLGGGAGAIDSGSTSALLGIMLAIETLLAGDNDMMICASGRRRMGLASFLGFEASNMLSPGAPKSLLEPGFDGIVPGEGVGVVLLKRLKDAQRDGDPIRAIIRGVGIAHHDDAELALRMARERSSEASRIPAQSLELMELDCDEKESADAALRAGFADALGNSNSQPKYFGSAAAQIGHLGGAAPMASLLKAILELQHGETAPTLHAERTRFGQAQCLSADEPRYGAVSSWSRGQAVHLVLQVGKDAPLKTTAASPVQTVMPSAAQAKNNSGARIIRFTAPSWSVLKTTLDACGDVQIESLWQQPGTTFQAGDRVRAALVADSPAALRKKLDLLRSQLTSAGVTATAAPVLEEQGIFARAVPTARPRVVFVFPGQGSQYSGMLKSLAAENPVVAAELQRLSETMRRQNLPTFEELAWEHGDALGSDIQATQLSMLLADALSFAALRATGATPDLVLGHSYGEFPALFAAGVFDLTTAAVLTKARCDGVANAREINTGLLATDASREELEALLPQVARELYIANRNAPDQHVIGGRIADFDYLSQQLTARKRQARRLAVPAAFHTPLLDGASRLLAQALQSAALRPPQIPFVSTVTNRAVSDPHEIAANLVAQLTTPVNYADLIARLAAEEPTVFVEVGPSRMLTKLNRRILAATASDGVVNLIGTDQPNKSGPETLLAVQALLECLSAAGPAPLSVKRPPTASPVPHSNLPPVAKNVVKSPVIQSPVSAAPLTSTMKAQIIYFDATQRRREKKRAESQRESAPPTPASMATPPPTPVAPPPIPVAPRTPISAPVSAAPQQSQPLNGHQVNAKPANAPAPATARTPTPVPAPAPVAQAKQEQPKQPALSAGELEKFLINFVVEQTGYPPEVVDLDADLEADLGIDSIKKAQLFGELQEYLDISAAADGKVALDDFRTLRNVLNFLVQSGDDQPQQPAAPPAPVAAAPVAATINQPPIAPAPAPTPAPAAQPKQPALSTGELEKFLINFVVEQTGYPAEVVDLDADLEADLGIDSIKKAQLFGELQEYLDISAAADGKVALDEFRTLRNVMDFLVKAGDQQPAAAPAPVASAPLAPAPVSATNVPAPSAPAPTPAPAAQPKQPALNAGELEKFLINFVVEQTGYPAEVVDLDADLEADLGIDSIKKAQLFGELQEYLDISAAADGKVALDEFRTLRNVMDFLVQAGSGSTTQAVAQASAPAAEEPAAGGTPYDQGHAFGKKHQVEILRALFQAVQGASPAGGYPSSELDDLSADELDFRQGMADAVQVPLSSLLANGPALRSLSSSYPAFLKRRPDVSKKADAASLSDVDPNQVTRRFSLSPRLAPLASNSRSSPEWQGDAIVLGAGPTAIALQQTLAQAGVQVWILAPDKPLPELLNELDAILARGPAPHLFLLSGRDCPPPDWDDALQFELQAQRGWVTPFFVVQHWLRAAISGNWLTRSSLAAVTALGSDFGFSGRGQTAQGGIAGLLKSLHVEFALQPEWQGFRVKALHAPSDAAPATIVGWLLSELANDGSIGEVAYDSSGRYLATPSERRLPELIDDGVRAGSVWVVTGGARGITAAVALALAQRYKLELHLIGTSPLPTRDPRWGDLSADDLKRIKSETLLAARSAGLSLPQEWARVQKNIEIVRSLEAFASAGIKFNYHCCDVSERTALDRILQSVREQSGPIEGVVHGAGIDRSTRFEKKKPEDVLATLAVKVDGAANLMALTRRDPVRHFIAFGSMSGLIGGMGQADYSLANDLLAKLVDDYRRKRPWIRAATFHWHGWDDIGMAARPETKAVLHALVNLKFMPPAEGIEHLLREVAAGLPEPEVMITQRSQRDRFFGATTQVEQPGASEEPPQSYQAPVAPPKLEMKRCEFRALNAPLRFDDPATFRFDSPVWIYGDNSAARATASLLQTQGVDVHFIPVAADAESAFAEVERLWVIAPAKYLLLLNSGDAESCNLADASGLKQRLWKDCLLPYFLTQQWYKLLLARPDLGTGIMLGAVSLGGSFGFSGAVPAPHSGAIAGLLKGLGVEDSLKTRRVRVKVIDAPTDSSPETLARNWLRELAADQPDVEVAWHQDERRVIRPLEFSIPQVVQPMELRGGTWVVTGGGRGITAYAVQALAQRYGWKVHLLGKSPLPKPDAPWRNFSEEELKAYRLARSRTALQEGRSPGEDWESIRVDIELAKNLRQFAAAGIDFEYHQCDVTDREATAGTLAAIKAKRGTIDGVLHGAGITSPGRFEHRPAGSVTKMFAGKFNGALNVLAQLDLDKLKYFIGFGSIGGRFGGNCLTDYAAANDALAKTADWLRANYPQCRAACIHWELWDGVGMAAQPKNALMQNSVQNMKYMSCDEGVYRLMQELDAGLPSREVLYTFGEFYPQFYPHEQYPLGEFQPQPAAQAPSAQPTKPDKWPLLTPFAGTVDNPVPGTWYGQCLLDPLKEPFLREHRLRGKPLLPIVVALEMLAEAALARKGGAVAGFENVQAVDGLFFQTDQPLEVRVAATDTEHESQVQGELTCDFRTRTGKLVQKNRPYLRADVLLSSSSSVPRVELPPAPGPWTPHAFPEDAPIYHGPIYRGIEAFHCQKTEAWAQITALPLADLAQPHRVNGWTVPSGVLDNCLYVCGIHFWLFGREASALPQSLKSVQIGRLPRDGEECRMHLSCREIGRDAGIYDFTLVGADETLILRVAGFRIVGLVERLTAVRNS